MTDTIEAESHHLIQVGHVSLYSGVRTLCFHKILSSSFSPVKQCRAAEPAEVLLTFGRVVQWAVYRIAHNGLRQAKDAHPG